jgi:hypothetical protein
MFACATAVAAVLSTAPSALAEPGVPCPFYGMNPGAPIWNGQILLDSAYAQAIADGGARAVRINFRIDDAATWDAGALATYDQIVDASIAAGLEPLGLVAYETVPGGQAAWNDDPDGDGYNDYVGQFASTTSVLFSHFAGRIRLWEVWNEPNCWSNPNHASDPQNAGCSYVLPRVLAKLLAETYVANEAAIVSGDVSLVSGGLFSHDIGGSSSTSSDYLGELYAQGVWDWMEANKGRRYPWDEIGYHVYVEQGQATDGATIGAYLDDVRALASANGDEHPFRMTEIGWTTAGVSEDVQAANLTTVFTTLAARDDMTSVYWFSFSDAPAADLYFGITNGDGSAKAGLDAMKNVAAGCVQSPGMGGGGAGPGGGGAGGGSGGAGGIPETGGTGGAGAGAGGAAGGSGGGGSPGDGTAGCACRAARGSAGETGAWLSIAGALLLLGRRRRAGRAVSKPSRGIEYV